MAAEYQQGYVAILIYKINNGLATSYKDMLEMYRCRRHEVMYIEMEIIEREYSDSELS